MTSWRHRCGRACEIFWWKGSASFWPCPATNSSLMRSLDWEHLEMTWGDRPPTFFFKQKQKQLLVVTRVRIAEKFKAEAIHTHKNIATNNFELTFALLGRGCRDCAPQISCVNQSQSVHLIPRPFLIHRSLAIHSQLSDAKSKFTRERKGKFKKTFAQSLKDLRLSAIFHEFHFISDLHRTVPLSIWHKIHDYCFT